MLQVCPALPNEKNWSHLISPDGTMTLGNFTLIYGQLQGQYIECAIRLDCLIEAVQGDSVSADKYKSCIATEPGK